MLWNCLDRFADVVCAPNQDCLDLQLTDSLPSCDLTSRIDHCSLHEVFPKILLFKEEILCGLSKQSNKALVNARLNHKKKEE